MDTRRRDAKRAKKKAKKKAKLPGNGWGVMLRNKKLLTFNRGPHRKTLPTKKLAEWMAKHRPGARAVRVQVEPVEE